MDDALFLSGENDESIVRSGTGASRDLKRPYRGVLKRRRVAQLSAQTLAEKVKAK